MIDHATAERRSLRYHREIASRIQRDERIVAAARKRVETWLESGSVAVLYAQAWGEHLLAPTAELCAFLVDTSEHACALRQVSPFAGVLNPREGGCFGPASVTHRLLHPRPRSAMTSGSSRSRRA